LEEDLKDPPSISKELYAFEGFWKTLTFYNHQPKEARITLHHQNQSDLPKIEERITSQTSLKEKEHLFLY